MLTMLGRILVQAFLIILLLYSAVSGKFDTCKSCSKTGLHEEFFDQHLIFLLWLKTSLFNPALGCAIAKTKITNKRHG